MAVAGVAAGAAAGQGHKGQAMTMGATTATDSELSNLGCVGKLREKATNVFQCASHDSKPKMVKMKSEDDPRILSSTGLCFVRFKPILAQVGPNLLKGNFPFFFFFSGGAAKGGCCPHSWPAAPLPFISAFIHVFMEGGSQQLVTPFQGGGPWADCSTLLEVLCACFVFLFSLGSPGIGSPTRGIHTSERDKELLGSNTNHLRVIVLCATEDKAAKTLHCFNVVTYITQIAELKSSKDCASPNNRQSRASIGLMIGTPFEILQYIEEKSVVSIEIKYLVLDEVDYMLGSGLDLEIHKIIRPLQAQESKSSIKRLQTILAISTIAEVLGEQSPVVKHLECDHTGDISAMSLEMEPAEVFHFTKSLHALRKKLVEAMDSLLKQQ
ncbi:hypothetical protein Fmac_001621 [Flemingia macrophylla]|uniref:DEAD/DEAH-box helicase domain-containing protein n=1 Tax=Flemingia macrophylla TaxID=520843 RepID=A0ABD1NHM7_9FABA